MKQELIRVKDRDGAHYLFATIEQAHALIFAGLAHTYGTRKKVHGLQLIVNQAQASRELYGEEFHGRPAAALGLKTVYEQHVGVFYVWAHRQLPLGLDVSQEVARASIPAAAR